MTIVTKNSLTLSNVNDGTITHTAYSWSADGKDGFTTVYPNLNLLDGTKDFSGDWNNSISWETDGTYKGLTVKKRTAPWVGINKIFTAPKEGVYTFSAYVKSSVNNAKIARYTNLNGTGYWDVYKDFGNNFDWLRDSFTVTLKAKDTIFTRYEITGSETDSILWTAGHKWEQGSIATPWMPSSSEVTTADWPSYIGQYSDFTSIVSTDPAKYAPWTVFKGKDGIAGKDGTGIQTTTITYAGSTSGTTAPTSGWTSTIPTVAAGSYLWTKTIWAYTDNTSKTGYSVAKMGNDGSNGDPGKIVSDTEPTTRFKGLTWKYLGTSDLTASDGTVILSGTEYYWSGTNWILSEINAHNINGDNLNVTNGTFTDGVIETSWKNGTVAGSTNIENDHLIITRTDSSVNTTNSIGLDSTQGLIMVYTENSTGRTISVGTNFQGMFLTDSTGISASISPAGVKLSSDVVNWTPVGNITLGKAIWKRVNNEITLSVSSGSSTGNFPDITSSGTLIGTLPANARPERNIDMAASGRSASSTAQISINTMGEIKCYRWGGDAPYFAAYVKFFASQ